MTKQSLSIVVALLLPLLICPIGCEQGNRTESASPKVSIVDEVMGRVTEKPVESGAAKEESNNLEPSIVKEFPEAETISNAAAAPESVKTKSVAPSESAAPKNSFKITTDDPTKPWTTTDKLPREIWEVQYRGSNPVGVFHRRIAKMEGSGDIRNEAESRIRVSIKQEAFEQHVRLSTMESINGELLSLSGEITMGKNKKTFSGRFQSDALVLSADENGKTSTVSIPWETKFRGPFAVEQSMLRNPLQPRETRKLKYFDPLLGRMVDGRLEASEYSSTPTMLNGFQELLEVRNVGMVGDSGAQALLWVDAKGEGYKSYIVANDILSFRTEPLAAQVVSSMFDLRNLDSVAVPLTGAVDRLAKNTKAMTYEVKQKASDPYRLFSDRVGQKISSIDAQTARVTVYRGGRGADLFQEADEFKKEEPDALAASTYVPADSMGIPARARALVATDKQLSLETATNLQKAAVCRRLIQKFISLKEFDKWIGPFPNILRTRQANCMEHALFFAAHCRALKVPTRIALGMKYNKVAESPQMIFHAWVEIREGNRWIPMDSSEDLPQTNSAEESSTAVDRIKIKEFYFNTPNPYPEILDVFRQLSELSVKVSEEEPKQ